MDLRITLKFVKTEKSAVIAVNLQPCTNAFAVVDNDYTVNNESETILCIIVKKDLAQQLCFDLLLPVRRVVLDGTDLPFAISKNKLSLTLPALSSDRDRSADMHMIVPFTGVELRIEVAHPCQSSGE